MAEERPVRPSDSAAKANRLSEETSPYLLQHKDNPVDWYPWGPEALEEAARSQRPILLSIGYAACHWCHVMAHESFENQAIAAEMNRRFVNIKVDREERPDLDGIYQNALALLGEQGGWPLTMFLTPKGEPFWGGTYFPPEPRFGRPGFPQVLAAISEAYATDPESVAKNVTALKEALERLASPQSAAALPPGVLDQVAERLLREFDPFHGGIGQAPKFPQTPILELIWRAWKRSGQTPYRDAVLLALRKMSQGGIYDHLGGGYARYAVDQRWLVPHFEKMLYDNAQLLRLLGWAWLETRDPLFESRARETVAWLLREMRAGDREGGHVDGFASSLDADSEGEEGRFYVWSEAEIDEALGEEAARFKEIYDVTPQGNWENRTILNRIEAERALAKAREKLFSIRQRRQRPGWDDKVLADWNGLMITALAEAAVVFDAPEWLAAAEQAFTCVCTSMNGEEGLRHAWRHGRSKPHAMLDDYASMIEAALALHLASGQMAYLQQAEAWVEEAQRRFHDPQGGFFLTADDAEALVIRPKNAHDGAVSSANGVLAGTLGKLHMITGEARYGELAQEIVSAFGGELSRNVFPLAGLLNGVDTLTRQTQVVIVGKPGDRAARALLDAALAGGDPARSVQRLAPDSELPEGHAAQGKLQGEGGARGFVCRDMTCSPPVTTPEAMSEALAA
jgi:uncharacterized protein YyaL (SSP411 family)